MDATQKPCCRKCKSSDGNIILKFEQLGEKVFDHNDNKDKNGYCYMCFQREFGIHVSNNNDL